MSTLAPTRGSQTTHLLEQPPINDLDHRTPGQREAAPPTPKSPDHVKRKTKPIMSTTLSPPKETTTTTTVRLPETTGTATEQTSREPGLLQRLWRRLRPVPGSLRPQDHMDPIHWHYGTVHPMHLR